MDHIKIATKKYKNQKFFIVWGDFVFFRGKTHWVIFRGKKVGDFLGAGRLYFLAILI